MIRGNLGTALYEGYGRGGAAAEERGSRWLVRLGIIMPVAIASVVTARIWIAWGWVGTGDGGLNCFKSGHVTAEPSPELLPHAIVTAICGSHDGALWAGTATGELFRLRKGRTESYQEKLGFPSGGIWALCEDPAGALWIGVQGAGLCRYGPGGLKVFTADDGRTSDAMRSICEDRDGAIWVATDGGGLNVLRDGRFIAYRASAGLGSDFVSSVYEDRDGSLWIGTAGGGLNRLRDGEFVTYGTREGLTSELILLVDFTNQARGRGLDRRAALIQVGSTRLRPIVMTTLAMIFGMLPLALGIGAGAELCRCAWLAIKTYMLESLEEDVLPAAILTILTSGQFLNWNPHIHGLITFGTQKREWSVSTPRTTPCADHMICELTITYAATILLSMETPLTAGRTTAQRGNGRSGPPLSPLSSIIPAAVARNHSPIAQRVSIMSLRIGNASVDLLATRHHEGDVGIDVVRREGTLGVVVLK